MPPEILLRSVVFVPGTRPEFLPKEKPRNRVRLFSTLKIRSDQARSSVPAALQARSDRLTLVRINHPQGGMIEADVAALAPHVSQAIVLPKLESVEDVAIVDRAVSLFERSSGLPAYAIGLIIGIESALGLRVLFEALRVTPRASGAALATAEEGDLLADLRGRWTPEGQALSYSHRKFVCDARAARMSWLLDGARRSTTWALNGPSKLTESRTQAVG